MKGPCLKDCFKFCDYKFSTETVAYLGIEILNRIEQIHNIGQRGYIV